MSESNIDCETKVVFLGASSVGKTSIIQRMTTNEFFEDKESTVGGAYCGLDKEHEGVKIKLSIWDTAGQERYKSLAPMYYRGAQIALLCFTLTDSQTLETVKEWKKEIDINCESRPHIIVVGNKLDLVSERQVSAAQGENVAKDIDADYYEVSAKTAQGMEDLLNSIVIESYQLYKKIHPQDQPKLDLDEKSKSKKKKSSFFAKCSI